jgi:hypothetical protein
VSLMYHYSEAPTNVHIAPLSSLTSNICPFHVHDLKNGVLIFNSARTTFDSCSYRYPLYHTIDGGYCDGSIEL